MKSLSKLLSIVALAVTAGLCAAPAHALEFDYSYPAQKEIESRQITPDHVLNSPNTTYYNHVQAAEETTGQTAPKLDAVIHFASNSVTLSPVSAQHVRKIAHMLKHPAYQGTHVTVQGFSDASGKAAVNQRLSHERAMTVMHELIKDGVPAGMLSAEGFGKENPIATNSTAEGRAQNRRVSFNVTCPTK